MAEGGNEGQMMTARSGTHDVFISYASQDTAVANDVAAALEGHDIKCWIAPRDITPGAHYASEIVHAIDSAKTIVLILSQDAAISPHVLREVERATSKRHPVVTLRLDQAPLPAEFEYFLNTSQWLEASGRETTRAMPKLVAAVRVAIDKPAAPDAAIPVRGTHAPYRAGGGWPLRRIAIVLGFLATVSIGGFAAYRLWLLPAQVAAPEAPIVTVTTTAVPATPSFNPPANSIAVLPFVNMSGDPKQDYFSDGISEELLDSLSHLNNLQVAARTSSFSFRGQNVDIPTIALKLNVSAILEGSVRRAGNTVRITVQLINAVSGFHMWSQTYDRNMTDILKIQRDLATSVAQQLKIKLTEDQSAKLEVGGTKNPEAYDAYLRSARSYNEADTQVAALNTALAAANQAISLDPDYSAAHMLRASVLFRITLFTNDLDSRNRLREQANMAAQRAVTLAPDFGEAHLALAIIRAHALLDFRGAAGEYERALALAPGSASVQRFFAFFAAEMGHFEPAVTAARRAVSLDPQNFASHRFLGEVLHLARRYAEAQAAYQDSKALNPDSHLLNDWMNETLLASGQTELARLRCESHTTPLDDEDRHKCLAVAYHGLNRQEDAEREFNQFRTLGEEAPSFDYAGIYAQWGNAPAALRWLTKAERQRSTDLAFLRVDWKMDPIRGEPQFKAIEAKMNFPP